MPACRICRSPRQRFVTDFGKLAVTNQFVCEDGATVFRQPISWLACEACGVVQLAEAPPVEQIRPRFDWITYREPERHLDRVAETLVRVAGLKPDRRVVGLTYKDDPLLKRLGSWETRQFDPARDLGISSSLFGLETIQAAWTIERARRVAARHGTADVLIARHVLEHAHDAAEFLAACRTLLSADGVLFVEVPDCARAFREVDVTVVWEEHTLYFTERTLLQSLSAAGFETLDFQRAAYAVEDCLLWMGRPLSRPGNSSAIQNSVASEPDVDRFARDWPQRRDSMRAWAGRLRHEGGRLAVYGAGHRACTLIDLMGLSEFIDCVIDDAPEKHSLGFPGGGLPIRASSALLDRRITCCLLAVNPEAEDRIVAGHSEFVAEGGTFVSCSPSSSRALRLP